MFYFCVYDLLKFLFPKLLIIKKRLALKIPACGDCNSRVRRWSFPRAALKIPACGVTISLI